MNKNEIGRFYATSFDGVVIEFIVFDDKTISCPALNGNFFRTMTLKPRFIMRGTKSYYEYNVLGSIFDGSKLIGNYDIDDELFSYLKENSMIRYSTDMAYFYGFEDKQGYDCRPGQFSVKSPFKWAKKKGPILVKQKKGQFN